jgi:hypothetical protein
MGETLLFLKELISPDCGLPSYKHFTATRLLLTDSEGATAITGNQHEL